MLANAIALVWSSLVQTESGLRPIEELGAGDHVWSVDPDSGEWSLQSVVEPLVNDYSRDLISITVAGETIEGTGGHPFLVLSGKELNARPFVEALHGVDACAIGRWVEARHIRIGDMLLLRSGQQVRVASLSSRQATLKVYNLHVGRQHTYAVAATVVGAKAVKGVGSGARAVGRGLLPNKAWKLPPVKRGMILEKKLGQNLPQNFPVFVKVSPGGVYTSIKTMNVAAKTYKNAGKLKSKLQSYIDQVADFGLQGGSTSSIVDLNLADIKVRELLLIRKRWTRLTRRQKQALREARGYARSRGVKFRVRRR